MRTRAICAAVLLAGLPAAPRSEDSIGVMPVAPAPGPTPSLVDVTGQLRRALSERVGGVLEPAQLRLRMGDAGSGSSLAETNRGYEAARAAELSGDPLRAMDGLQGVIQELEGLPESPEAFAQWSRAMLRLAKIQSLVSGHEEEARATLERLFRTDPDARVDPAVHGPDLAQLGEGVRKRLASLDQRRLTITSASTDVRVFLNGREVGSAGASPLVLVLPAGRYRVSAIRGGKLRNPPVPVDLTGADQRLALDFTIAELLRPAQGPGLATSPLDTNGIFRVAGYLHLDTVITTNYVESDAVTYLVGTAYDVRRGKMRVSGVMHLLNQAPPPGGVEALADYLLTGEKAKGVVKRYDPKLEDWKVPRTALAGEPPPPRNAKGWIAFTTGLSTVALTGVSIWQAKVSSDDYAKARKQLNPDGSLPADRSGYNSLVSKGDSAKRTAMITGIGAGACAVSTVVLGYLSYKQSGEIGPFRF